MSVAYIIGMGAAYTAALWLLVRRLRLPGRGYLPEKTLCSLCFVAVAAVCAALGSRPEAFLALAAGAAVLCGGGCGAGALQQAAPSGPVFGRVGGPFWQDTACLCGACANCSPWAGRLPLAAVLGAGGAAVLSGMPGMQTGRMRPLVVLYGSLCPRRCWARDCSWPLVWASPGAFWCWQGGAVLDFGSADPVFVFLPSQTHCRARGQSSDLLLCHVSDCSKPRGLKTGTLYNFAATVLPFLFPVADVSLPLPLPTAAILVDGVGYFSQEEVGKHERGNDAGTGPPGLFGGRIAKNCWGRTVPPVLPKRW